MTSVQNLLRLLSGNNLLLLLFVIVMYACGSSKKVSTKSNNEKKTETNSSASNKNKVKEVEWKEVENPSKPPIVNTKKEIPVDGTVKGEAGLVKEDVYDITYFIPFEASSYVNSSSASDRFVQYYAGMQIAKDVLEREGVRLNVNVVDEEVRNFDDLLTQEVSESTDLIVGPYNREHLKSAASYGLKKRIPVVSPWQASNKITDNNPFYVQLRPNLDEHYVSILNHIKDNFKLDQVYIVGRQSNDNDAKRIKSIQSKARVIWNEKDLQVIQESLLLQDSIDFGVTAYDSLMFHNKETVVIIPHWSFDDEAFIYGALRKLSVEKGLQKVYVYGMPIMLDSDKINFDYYNSLNMKVARSKFVDERDGDVQRFKRDFVQRFGAIPTHDAYEGYDNLMFVGRNLQEYGKNFQFYLDRDSGYYLQAAYNVEASLKTKNTDKFEDVNYFENKNVDIIEFKNARFQRSTK